MSAISCDQIVASLPRVTCACGEPIRFDLYRDERHRAYRLGVRHGGQNLLHQISEEASYYYRGEFGALIIRTFREMAERVMQECPRAAWHSTGEIEFRDGHREYFRASPSHLLDVEDMLNYERVAALDALALGKALERDLANVESRVLAGTPLQSAAAKPKQPAPPKCSDEPRPLSASIAPRSLLL